MRSSAHFRGRGLLTVPQKSPFSVLIVTVVSARSPAPAVTVPATETAPNTAITMALGSNFGFTDPPLTGSPQGHGGRATFPSGQVWQGSLPRLV